MNKYILCSAVLLCIANMHGMKKLDLCSKVSEDIGQSDVYKAPVDLIIEDINQSDVYGVKNKWNIHFKHINLESPDFLNKETKEIVSRCREQSLSSCVAAQVAVIKIKDAPSYSTPGVLALGIGAALGYYAYQKYNPSIELAKGYGLGMLYHVFSQCKVQTLSCLSSMIGIGFLCKEYKNNQIRKKHIDAQEINNFFNPTDFELLLVND